MDRPYARQGFFTFLRPPPLEPFPIFGPGKGTEEDIPSLKWIGLNQQEAPPALGHTRAIAEDRRDTRLKLERES